MMPQIGHWSLLSKRGTFNSRRHVCDKMFQSGKGWNCWQVMQKFLSMKYKSVLNDLVRNMPKLS